MPVKYHRLDFTNPDTNLSKVVSAFEFAMMAHNGQLRRGGAPYVIHPWRVWQIAADFIRRYRIPYSQSIRTDIECICYLHDVIEDCGVDKEELSNMFGDRIANAVDRLSDRGGESFSDSCSRLNDGLMYVHLVKASDIVDNVLDSSHGNAKRHRDYCYKKAEQIEHLDKLPDRMIDDIHGIINNKILALRNAG